MSTLLDEITRLLKRHPDIVSLKFGEVMVQFKDASKNMTVYKRDELISVEALSEAIDYWEKYESETV